MTHRRLLVPAITVPGVALVVTAVLAAAAVRSLAAAGPNPVGYDLLLQAGRAAVADAVLVSLSGIVLAARGTRLVAGALAAAAAVTLTAAVGAHELGSALADVQPLEQPAELHSLLLAVAGSGATILPAAIVLAAAAGTAFCIGRRRAARRPAARVLPATV